MATNLINNCHNCEALLAPEHLYCARCGQKATIARITMREIGSDVVHALVSVDRSALSLIGALLARPGHVARDYVAGKRKRYFSPFAFLLIAVGLTSAIIAVSGFRAFVTNNPNVLADFLQRHVNLVILLQVPLIAAFTSVLFRGAGLNYAEHLVLASFVSGMRALFLGLVAVPYWYVFPPTGSGALTIYLYFAIWLAYFGMAAAQFYNGRRAWSWLKAILAAALAQATTIGLVALTSFVFFRYVARS